MINNEIISDLNKKYRRAKEKQINTNENMEKAIKVAINKVKKNYETRINNNTDEVEKSFSNLVEYIEKFKDICSFNIEEIVKYLLSYINEVEKSEYTILPNDYYIDNSLIIFIKNDFNKNLLLSKDDFNEAVLKRDILVIKPYFLLDNNNILFYRSIIDKDRIKTIINVSAYSFEYILDFIDECINYRIKNKINKLSDVDYERIINDLKNETPSIIKK